MLKQVVACRIETLLALLSKMGGGKKGKQGNEEEKLDGDDGGDWRQKKEKSGIGAHNRGIRDAQVVQRRRPPPPSL